VERVLVTGAGGFAGSHLVQLLEQSGAAVTGWHRRHVDLLDREAVTRGIGELLPSVVYHVAGAAHVGQSFSDVRETLAANVIGTHHVIDALRTAGLTARVLIPGSALVYRQCERALIEDDPTGPGNPYALSKLAQEMLGRRGIAEDGQQVFLTRSFNHTGPGQAPSFAASGFARQIAMIEAGKMAPTIEVGNLEAARDITDVRDTARAYHQIVQRGRPGVIYNVCSGRAYKIRDVLDRLVAQSRVPVSVRVDPARYRPNDNPLLLGDPARIGRDVGWQATIPLEQTLSDLLEYWRKDIK
jgi:GDP-4-dehydro-6-deoxy-D-mannose reductase